MNLRAEKISKEFPGIRALDEVTIEFKPGQIHGIIGENGAGKSTLMKIISGVYQPDGGELILDGVAAKFSNAREAIDRRIAMIHQELNLIESLTVAENISLGREPLQHGFINRAESMRIAQEALDSIGATFSPTVEVSQLSLAQKQLVEIAKAVSTRAELVIFDEPTAVLSENEVLSLFALIRKLKEAGKTIVYISHILKEIRTLCDEVTVLRDGAVVAQIKPETFSEIQLATLMVGRELSNFYPSKNEKIGVEPIFGVTGLGSTRLPNSVSFALRAGEIVGIAGLIGCGRTETAETLLGLRPTVRGEVRMEGKVIKPKSPEEAKRLGLVYVSEDRKGAGLVQMISCRDNATLANLENYRPNWLDSNREEKKFGEWVEKLSIKVNRSDQAISSLSGGNQQKIAIAKWLETNPKVLILDEPTRGVDVGAKREIYELIQHLAGQGLACLVISSEMQELLGLCHSLVVMRNGETVGELKGDEMTETAVMVLAAGTTSESAA